MSEAQHIYVGSILGIGLMFAVIVMLTVLLYRRTKQLDRLQQALHRQPTSQNSSQEREGSVLEAEVSE